MQRSYLWKAVKTALLVPAAAGVMSASVNAQEAADDVEVIQVTGIVSSLKRSIEDKKEAVIVSDGISAEDLGKFPDLNVAESLQRITGVSIDRTGGEGQQVTVRGLGPQFNLVLVNGRQIASDAPGREFNFDVLSADLISGADVYKSTRADFQEGGIGATVNVSTARPFDYEGFQFAGSVKGVYETLSENTAPQASALVSNTFNDGKFGVLFAVSHQERDLQVNRIETAGWRPGLTISNARDGVLASNVFLPRNIDQIIETQDRTRTNANLTLQFAPSEDMTITLDGFYSAFEIDALATDFASWFEADRVGDIEVDPETGTALFFTQEIGLHQGSGDPRTDFVSHTRNGRDVENFGGGLNVEWLIHDQLHANFDLSTSEAENDFAGRSRFNVIGIDNNYQFDTRSGIPVVTHDGFSGGNLLPAELARAHFNDRGGVGFSVEDEILEAKADFTYYSDNDVFQRANFGVYYQDREKSQFQESTTAGCAFCGYILPVPPELLQVFQPGDFFNGLNPFYTYDGEEYFRFLEQPGSADRQDEILGRPIGTTAAILGDGFVPVLQNNRFTVNEEITSLYVDFTFGYDLGDVPITLNFGVRYSETDIDVAAIQSTITDVVPTSDLTLFSNVLSAPADFSEGGSYSNILPSLNIKAELTDTMVLRFSTYDSLTRPTLSQLSPATIFNEPRRQNLTASGGNPTLEPFQAENWDLSFEWYYGDASYFSLAFFNKEIEDFIITLTGQETFTLSDRADEPDFRCDDANSPQCATSDFILTTEELFGLQEVYNVTRPQNGETADVQGYEIAWTHVWESGFGITLNATIVDSDASLGDDTTRSFALEGLGDSQNAVFFYERGPWQARLAFNNREGFLRALDNGFNGEPINTDTFGQWDISGSYEVNDNWTVFFEGINITEEELVQRGRFANQVFSVEDNGSRYSLGVRAKF